MKTTLRRPGRLIALVSLVAAAVATSCGSTASSQAAPKPSPSPVTAASVADAVKSSSMTSGHFAVTATIVYSGKLYAATGVGAIERQPYTALQFSLKVDTKTSTGVIQYEEVNIGGVKYWRVVGITGWRSAQSTFSPTSMTPDKYVAEETVNGVKCWHAESIAAAGTYDIWVKESDGYIPKLAYAGTDGTAYTLIFDSYNTTPAIVAPAGA